MGVWNSWESFMVVFNPIILKFFQKMKIENQIESSSTFSTLQKSLGRFWTPPPPPEFESHCTESDALYKSDLSNFLKLACLFVLWRLKNTFSICIPTVTMKNLIKFHNIVLSFAKIHKTKFDLAFLTLKLLPECLETYGLILATHSAFTCAKSTIETLKKICEIFSKFKIKTPERPQIRRFSVFTVNFERISFLFLEFLILTLSR